MIAWIASIVSMVGSLFFSEVMKFVPCNFCWYQRILMYPLVILLGVAFYQQDHKVTRYVLPLSIMGIIVSGYHYALQKIPALKAFEVCTSGIPCSGQYINWLGFITIPLLAFVGFTTITICMLWMRKQSN
nr:disulfide oxidoreductase [Fictibacillus sp. 5RED26]